MQQISKEDLEKKMENLTEDEKIELLKNTNEMVKEMNGVIEEYLKNAE